MKSKKIKNIFKDHEVRINEYNGDLSEIKINKDSFEFTILSKMYITDVRISNIMKIQSELESIGLSINSIESIKPWKMGDPIFMRYNITKYDKSIHDTDINDINLEKFTAWKDEETGEIFTDPFKESSVDFVLKRVGIHVDESIYKYDEEYEEYVEIPNISDFADWYSKEIESISLESNIINIIQLKKLYYMMQKSSEYKDQYLLIGFYAFGGGLGITLVGNNP